MRPDDDTLRSALLLGLAGALRSWPPLAAVILTGDRGRFRKPGWRDWPVLRSRLGRRVLIALGAAEFVADKLPGTQSRLALKVQPSRTDGGLVGRVAAVTVAGAALGSEHRDRNAVAVGAAGAAAGALLGNFSGYHARKAAIEATGLPDPAVAVVEDLVAIGLLGAAVGTR